MEIEINLQSKTNEKKILIVGHKGYVGSVLIHYLSKIKKFQGNIYGIDSNLFSLNNYKIQKKLTLMI